MKMALDWNLVSVDETTSTQDLAERLAREGAKQGTVVMARTQSEGRGRTGKSWLSPVGGLYVSLILRPPASSRLELLPLSTAFAVLDGLKASTGVSPSVRWPNDVLLGGRKVGGVICEASFSNRRLAYVIVGVGINCNSSAKSLGRLARIATTLAIETNREIDVSAVLRGLLSSFEGVYQRWVRGDDLVEDRRSQISTMGKRVALIMKDSNRRVTCLAKDVQKDGSLVIVRRGKTEAVKAEDVDSLVELDSD